MLPRQRTVRPCQSSVEIVKAESFVSLNYACAPFIKSYGGKGFCCPLHSKGVRVDSDSHCHLLMARPGWVKHQLALTLPLFCPVGLRQKSPLCSNCFTPRLWAVTVTCSRHRKEDPRIGGVKRQGVGKVSFLGGLRFSSVLSGRNAESIYTLRRTL